MTRSQLLNLFCNLSTLLFSGDVRNHLSKHLLKSLASDVTNILFEMVANDNLMSLPENDVFTPEVRLITSN